MALGVLASSVFCGVALHVLLCEPLQLHRLLALAVLVAASMAIFTAVVARTWGQMRELERKNAQFQVALEGADEGFWDWDIAANRTTYSEHWSRMLGYSPEEIGQSVEVWEELVHPEDRGESLERLRAHLEGRTEQYQSEFRMRAKSGEWRWIQARGKVMARGADGRPVRVAGTHIDVTRARQLADELAAAQQRLVALSRTAGMAEVATGVIHNVGNVLNSLNVSATVVREKLEDLRVAKLNGAVRMLEEHAGDAGTFLSEDPRGQRLIPYLVKLSRNLERERGALVSEMELLVRHVGHIREIVARQQSYARAACVVQEVSLAELIGEACLLMEREFARSGVKLETEVEDFPEARLDAHKILQILVNLMRNAIQAVAGCAAGERRVHIRARRRAQTFHVEVEDNGAGLAPENLPRIFSHGFTTKPDGHGFGLHSGWLAAREMGGSLSVESDGPGRGARFLLVLPLDAGARQSSTRENSQVAAGCRTEHCAECEQVCGTS